MFLNSINLQICNADTLFIFQIAMLIIRIIQILAPFALIIWGSLDFFKALIAGDEKDIKQKRKPFISRVIAAVIILLMPVLVNFIIQTIASGNTSTNNFATCWTKASKNVGIINLPKTSGSVQ